jgi:zinc protease
MKFNTYFKKFTFFSILSLLTVFSVFAQTPNFPEPREEKLLNGAKLLVWNDAKAEKVTIKIRIHSGSAFDPQGKEGTMQLLSDILFPNESARDFFTDDLGGNLEVITNYDYIQINASGNTDKFLTILETLATAVTNPQINKETTGKVRTALLLKVKELEKNPSYVADQAVAKRLFGNFPYGRPQLGSSESVAKIDFADILFADQKFLTADNSTIAITGNVKADFALRATKRLFGGWLKADKKVPATFAQPDKFDPKELLIEMPNLDKSFTTTATNTVGRSDKDYWATQILSKHWRKTYCFNNESSRGDLNYEPHLLRGIYFIRSSEILTKNEVNTTPNISMSSGQCSFFNLMNNGKSSYPTITQNEFDTLKQEVIADFQGKLQPSTNLLDLTLDIETYKLSSVRDELQKLNAVTLADLQRVEENVRKQPVAIVKITKPTEQKLNN